MYDWIGQENEPVRGANEISRRLSSIFLRDKDGRCPVFGDAQKFKSDPHWRDHILFYEYFHGDNGAGLGASHQTGWTGLVARLLQLQGILNPETFLELGRRMVLRDIQAPSLAKLVTESYLLEHPQATR